MTLRLVQAFGSRHRGGAQRFFLRLAEAMDAKGLQRGVLVKRGGWCEERLRHTPVAATSLPFGGALDLVTPFAYPRLLKKTDANVLLTWLERATKRAPAGPWVHAARLGGYYDLKDYRRCHHLIGNTPGVLDHFRKGGWPEHRIHYIPNFVPEAELGAVPASRAEFETPEGVPLIIWVGRMERIKGPDIVVRALASVPGAYLWLVGAGAFEAEVKILAADLGVSDRVRFLGWRDSIHGLLSAADIFVCASRFEVMGNVILEAWTHHLPVVACRSPGPEYLISGGVNGMLVENDAPGAMAGAMNTLIADPDFARRIAEAGWREVQTAYTETAVTGQYAELLSSLAIIRSPG